MRKSLTMLVSTIVFIWPEVITDRHRIEIMLYNLWGPWSSAVGPNAPLSDSCSPHKGGSVMDSVQAWTDAKFPVGQLVLSVPSYGYSYFVTPNNAIKDGQIAYYPPFDAAK